MKVISLAVVTVIAVFVAAVYTAKPAMAAEQSQQAKIEWHVVGAKVYFDKKETQKIGVGLGAVTTAGSFLPPPFDAIIVGVSALLTARASMAVIDGDCVGVRINPPLPFMPVATPFVYSPTKTGTGRYCR